MTASSSSIPPCTQSCAEILTEIGFCFGQTERIASNTSSLSIASIAASLKKPERCIGIHFFNPAPLMQLVEVIPAIQTSKEVLEKSIKIISDWKKVVAVAKDTPGFIVNRVARPFYGETKRSNFKYQGIERGESRFGNIGRDKRRAKKTFCRKSERSDH